MSGYARAHRSRWDHPLFKNKQEAAVWAWMCDVARFRTHSFQTRFGIVQLERGQLLASQRVIAEDFGLGRQQVRRLIDSMAIAGMIAENSTHSASRAGTIITIVNYDKYQTDSSADDERVTQAQHMGQPIINPRPTHNQPTREEREKREEREIEEESPSDSSNSVLSDPPAEEPINDQGGDLLVFPLPTADHVGTAFAAFEATRREFVPNGRPLTLGADRRRKLAARLRECGGMDGWSSMLADIRGSPFLRGETSQNGFVAEIDWLLEPKNFRKVMEGRYNNERSDRASSGRPAPRSTVSALNTARNRLGIG